MFTIEEKKMFTGKECGSLWYSQYLEPIEWYRNMFVGPKYFLGYELI